MPRRVAQRTAKGPEGESACSQATPNTSKAPEPQTLARWRTSGAPPASVRSPPSGCPAPSSICPRISMSAAEYSTCQTASQTSEYPS
jgi:hypothetical protein